MLEWLHRHATPFGVQVCLAISHLGSPFTLSCLALIGALVLIARSEWVLLSGWIVALVGEIALNEWLKLLVHRPRPIYATPYMHHPTWSFPSGHAMGSIVAYGLVAYVLLALGPRTPPFRFIVVSTAAALVIAIGVSRLYLGVHYLSDVVGGYAVGLCWLSLYVWGVEFAKRWRRPAARLHPTG